MDHTALFQWVQQYAPEIEKRLQGGSKKMALIIDVNSKMIYTTSNEIGHVAYIMQKTFLAYDWCIRHRCEKAEIDFIRTYKCFMVTNWVFLLSTRRKIECDFSKEM